MSLGLSIVLVGCSWSAVFRLGPPVAEGLCQAGAYPVEDSRDGQEVLRRDRGLFSQENRRGRENLIASFN